MTSTEARSSERTRNAWSELDPQSVKLMKSARNIPPRNSIVRNVPNELRGDFLLFLTGKFIFHNEYFTRIIISKRNKKVQKEKYRVNSIKDLSPHHRFWNFEKWTF